MKVFWKKEGSTHHRLAVTLLSSFQGTLTPQNQKHPNITNKSQKAKHKKGSNKQTTKLNLEPPNRH